VIAPVVDEELAVQEDARAVVTGRADPVLAADARDELARPARREVVVGDVTEPRINTESWGLVAFYEFGMF
jgi:hypothetical protein